MKKDMPSEWRQKSRRRILKATATGVFALVNVASVSRYAVAATFNESAGMNPTALVKALRLIGTPVCTDAADRLVTHSPTVASFDLHLRRASLDEADARILADAMRKEGTGNEPFLRSFSASYNPGLGDAGAVILARAFAETMTELGLVGCSISDVGGRSILRWAKAAPDLRMICVEGNSFSEDIRSQFHELKRHGRRVLVVV